MNKRYLQDWLFHYGDETHACDKGYDDSTWRRVTAPHDWSVGMPFSRENSSGTGYLSGGTGWYRAHFDLTEALRGKRAFLHFDGVYKNSRVWLNGYYLGERPSGYASFEYDVTDFLHCGDGENVLCLRVQHEDVADSRWFTGSGLYRKVTLRFCEPVYLEASSLFFRAEPQTDGTANVSITGLVRNHAANAACVDVRACLSQKGRDVLTLEQEDLHCAPGEGAAFRLTGSLRNPALWSVDAPNLYQLTLSLSGDSADCSEPLSVGIRSIRFDPDQGFFLNGQSMKLKGVCLHHDAGCLGAAVWPAVWERRLKKLRAMGANAIRMSHNPHMEELYDLCDRMGFLVMDEAFDEWENPKNKWSTGHNVYPPKHYGYAEHFPTWHERDLQSMVLRGRNHPSIFSYSIGNEIDYPNDPYVHPMFKEMTGNNDSNKPKAEMQYNPDKPDMGRLATIAKGLAAIVRQLDDTRPVLTASAFPELSKHLGFFNSLDIVGYNYKEQFYEDDHARFPALPILGSENGHSLEAWRAVTDHPYISGQFLWTGIDFLGETVGWPCHGSQAGLLDLAGNEKPGYYRRMSFWSDRPMVKLFTSINGQPPAHRYDYTPGQRVRVVCYTNQASAELYQDGVSLGKKTRDADRDAIEWEVDFVRGELRVVAGASEGVVEDQLASTLPGTKLILSPWPLSSLIEDELSAYRLHQIEVAVKDEQGYIAHGAEPMLHVAIDGPGTLLGIESGNLFDNEDYALAQRRAHRGRAIVYVLTPKAAEKAITLRISAEGFAPVECAL